MAQAEPKNIIKNLNLWLPRVLALCAIWGIAVFLWGTFSAISTRHLMEQEQRYAQAVQGATEAWLNNAAISLNRLAVDERMAAGARLPTGVESLPIQRVLYEFSYLNRKPEVYVFDLLRNRIGKTAGASALDSNMLEILSELNDGRTHMLVGMGIRNSQVLLLRKVDAPLPMRLYVGVPVDPAALGNSMPVLPAKYQRKVGLGIAHTRGWVAWDGSARFEENPELAAALDDQKVYLQQPSALTTLTPLNGWAGAVLTVEGPSAMAGTRLLPHLLVLLWALGMSALVLFHGTQASAKIRNALAPVTDPLERFVGSVEGMFMSTFSGILKQWQQANDESPLIAGPGGFEHQDFLSPERLAAMNGGKRRPMPQERKANLKTTEFGDVERRGKRRGKDKVVPPQMGAKPQFTWKEPAAPEAAKDDYKIDDTNLREVVEDCLRKKRIRLMYQPIYRTGDNMPVMHEVYARLIDQNGRVMMPDEFLPIAIRHRLALELDLQVLRKVVHEHFRGSSTPLTPLAVNISSTSLDGITYLQEMANLGPRVLQKMSFEVRSQEMIRDPKALRLLKELQKHGGNLAVDYFGGGNAMLDASKSMGFNYVKLDCNRFMDTDDGKKMMIQLCQYANKLNLPIILEKIGDKTGDDFGRRAGAQFLQGYALMKPQDKLSIHPLTPTLAGMKNLMP